jgi:hypothetical protein
LIASAARMSAKYEIRKQLSLLTFEEFADQKTRAASVSEKPVSDQPPVADAQSGQTTSQAPEISADQAVTPEAAEAITVQPIARLASAAVLEKETEVLNNAPFADSEPNSPPVILLLPGPPLRGSDSIDRGHVIRPEAAVLPDVSATIAAPLPHPPPVANPANRPILDSWQDIT